MRISYKRVLTGILASMMLVGAANAGDLLVYSSTDADNLKHYMDQFQKDNPDIKVKVVRESTGTMAAKMMAEKDNPQADVLFEMAATVALNMEAQGMFHPYTPKGMDKIDGVLPSLPQRPQELPSCDRCPAARCPVTSLPG